MFRSINKKLHIIFLITILVAFVTTLTSLFINDRASGLDIFDFNSWSCEMVDVNNIECDYLDGSGATKSITFTNPDVSAPARIWYSPDPTCGPNMEMASLTDVFSDTTIAFDLTFQPEIFGVCGDEQTVTVITTVASDVDTSVIGGGTPGEVLDETAYEEIDGTDDELTIEEGCSLAVGPVGWIFCPIIDMADGVYSFFKDRVQSLLLINEDSFSGGAGSTALYNSWSGVRNIANALVALVALIIIASQIFGFEFLSAYTVKKALPKVLIAVIAIQLSWIGLTALILLTNGVGEGIHNLLIYPFAQQGSADITSLYSSSSVGSATSTSLLGLGAIALSGAVLFAAGGGVFALLISLLSAMVAILLALFILLIRKLLIIILLAIAPIAIAAWIMPGTKNWFNIWWQLFSKLLLMLPLIMILFAAGTIGANLLFFQAADQTGPEAFFTTVAMLVVYFTPLFLIPATFKFAGGLFNKIINLGDKAKGSEKKFGWFGARDRAEIAKQKSAWKMSQEQKKGALQRKRDETYARRLTQPGKGVTSQYSRFMRHRAGIDDSSRARSEASAASTIQQAEEQQYKDQASLSRFYATSIARNKDAWSAHDFDNLSLYQREERVRDLMLKAANGEVALDTGGKTKVGVKIDENLKAATAIEALRNKDPDIDQSNPDRPKMSQGINQYINSPEGFRALKDYGTMDRDAWSVLAEKLPTAAKGAPTPGLDNPTVRGFEDAVKNFAKLGKAQQAEVRRGLLAQQQSDPHGVTAILSTFARNTEVTGEQLKAIESTIGQSLDLKSLRSNPTGKLTYTPGTTPGTGTFSIT